jgi:hypothetical protein
MRHRILHVFDMRALYVQNFGAVREVVANENVCVPISIQVGKEGYVRKPFPAARDQFNGLE